ncbi:epoxyqueuosine reductase QueH [Treponema sp.]|uniref:epoxyqueuosine reductase QueH n=1 Tax=Treponema sp. TaxID=166 RepID=UPI003F0F9D37
MNYYAELEKHLAQLKENAPLTARPTLLLHACCAPCSSHVMELISSFFDTTLYFYNPNIFPEDEYTRRRDELKHFLCVFPPAIKNSVKLVEDCYIPEEFYKAIKLKENPAIANEPEKGERCKRCYAFRLQRAFDFACKNNFDYFCTTLSISPFKDAEAINQLAEEICAQSKKTKWLPSDFKKKNGFLRSLELSKEFSLYRQQYCGCVFSMENANRIRAQQSKTEA